VRGGGDVLLGVACAFRIPRMEHNGVTLIG